MAPVLASADATHSVPEEFKAKPRRWQRWGQAEKSYSRSPNYHCCSSDSFGYYTTCDDECPERHHNRLLGSRGDAHGSRSKTLAS